MKLQDSLLDLYSGLNKIVSHIKGPLSTVAGLYHTMHRNPNVCMYILCSILGHQNANVLDNRASKASLGI